MPLLVLAIIENRKYSIYMRDIEKTSNNEMILRYTEKYYEENEDRHSNYKSTIWLVTIAFIVMYIIVNTMERCDPSYLKKIEIFE